MCGRGRGCALRWQGECVTRSRRHPPPQLPLTSSQSNMASGSELYTRSSMASAVTREGGRGSGRAGAHGPASRVTQTHDPPGDTGAHGGHVITKPHGPPDTGKRVVVTRLHNPMTHLTPGSGSLPAGTWCGRTAGAARARAAARRYCCHCRRRRGRRRAPPGGGRGGTRGLGGGVVVGGCNAAVAQWGRAQGPRARGLKSALPWMERGAGPLTAPPRPLYWKLSRWLALM